MGRLEAGLRRSASETCAAAVARGLPPAYLRWRWVREETLTDYFARGGRGRCEIVHKESRASNPLPRNVSDPRQLPSDPDWFGFSFRDVPSRVSGTTTKATLPESTVVSFNDPERDHFWPAIVNGDSRALKLREITFRRGHSAVLSSGRPPVRLAKATWFLERVYENYSHWLTAHLPKLCLLKERGELEHLILPARRSRFIDASLRMLGIDPAALCTHDPTRPLLVDELTVLETDRFRPELLRPVRKALGQPSSGPGRRIFISRRKARIRKLVNEAEITPIIKDAGFESVVMEELDFGAQIRLMGETDILLAPHGAGLTNMMFCRPGTQVVEIADITYPNPNFYALAYAMELPYWLVRGTFREDPARHRLERDLMVDPEGLRLVLRQIEG